MAIDDKKCGKACACGKHEYQRDRTIADSSHHESCYPVEAQESERHG